MSRGLFGLLLVSVLVGVVPGTWAQMTAVTNSTSTPIPGAGHDYIKMLSETVDPANGSLSLRIQVPVPPGRGLTIPFSFAYDSNGVHFVGNGPEPGDGGWFTIQNTDPSGLQIALGGWSYSVPTLSYQTLQFTEGAGGPSPCNYTGTGGFVFTDPTGGRHSLNLGHAFQPQPLTCGPHFTESDSASDPYYQAQLVGGLSPVIVSNDGTVYKFQNSSATGAGIVEVLPVVSIEDRNGNIATVNTDTLSRNSVSWSGFGKTGDTVTVSGLSNAYTLTWGTASSAFTPQQQASGAGQSTGCTLFGESASQPVITAIQLPNGTSYQFSYDTTFGQISKITYPTGGYVQYTWGVNSLSALGVFWPPANSGTVPCEVRYSKPAVTDRYVSFDGNTIAQHQHFTYSTTWNLATWTSKTTTLTTTDQVRSPNVTTTTVYNYGSVQAPDPVNIPTPPGDLQLPIENSVVYKDGTGNILKTVNKGWLNQFDLACEMETLDNGVISGVFYTYGQGDQVTDKKEYDYGQLSSTSVCQNNQNGVSPSGITPLRETVTTYQSFAATPTFPYATSIFDRPSTVQVYANGALASETDYGYDGSPVGGVPSLTQHDETNYSPSYNNRGNLTTKTVKCLQSCTNAVTTYTNDETGQVLSMTDPCGNATCTDMNGTIHITMYSYADSFSSGGPPAQTNAYLTKVTDALSHSSSFRYGYADGQLTSSTDANGNTTNYKYNTPPSGCSNSDGLDRLSEIDYPDAGKMTYCYDDAATSPSVTTMKLIGGGANVSLITKTVMDGLAHAIQSQLTSDPDGTDSTDTTYDGMDRLYTRSNPHRSSSSPTDGTTVFSYDALGRAVSVKQPDGSDIDTSYAGNCTMAMDEAGNPRKSCSDALGRLIEVDEPGVGGAPETSGGGVVNIGGAEQIGPPQPGKGGASLFNNARCYQTPGSTSWFPESGEVSLTVNGVSRVSLTEDWSGGSCNQSAENVVPNISQMAADLASRMTSSSAGVTATVDAGCAASSQTCSISVTANTAGASTNYSLTSSYRLNACNLPGGLCPGGSGVSLSSSGLSGGTDSTPDSGTVSVTVNGTTGSAQYGSGWTAQQIGTTLAAAFANNSSFSVSQNGASLSFTALDGGSDSNYTVSTSVTWNSIFSSPSFTACLQGMSCSSGTSSGTLTGGADSTLGSQPLVTLYSYDALNNLLCAVQKGPDTTAFTSCSAAPATWRPRSFAYDSLSRLTGTTNPESGTIAYTYDANGNLATKVSPKPNLGTTGTGTTTYFYDALNRLTQKTYANFGTATAKALYGYDGAALAGCNISLPSLPNAVNLIDRRSAACSGDTSSVYSYDVMGRPSEKRANKGSVFKGYSMLYTYYKDGSANTITYPSGDVVTYTVSGAGRVTQVSDSTNTFVGAPTSAVMYTPAGLLASMTQGSGITIGNTYNNRLQPSLLSAGSNSGGIMSLSYDFHAGHGDNGNVYQISDNLDSTRSAVFQYDTLNRLQQANTVTTTGANCWGEVYTIDVWGNLIGRSGPSGMAGCVTEGLSAAASIKNQLSGLTYDAAGDVVNDGNGNMPTYDAENRIATDQGFTYRYDADGLRGVKSNGTSGTMYWPDSSGNVLAETDLSGNINEEYIFFNGARIARIDRPSGTVNYYFSDYLRSSSVITDPNGNVQQRYYYYPYGGIVAETGSNSNHYLFTGKERDTESGLDNFGARYYTSNVGRFMSPDWSARPTPVPYAVFGDPQSLNLYGYVRNDPVSRADADGHCWLQLFRICSSGNRNGREPAQNQSDNAQRQAARAARRHELAQRIVLFVRGALDAKIGVEKIAAGAAAGASTPATGPLGAAGAAYGVISGTGQTVQGSAEIVGAITGKVKEANEASDALAASTTIGGVATTIATGGNVKAGAAAASVEQLGTSALQREVFEHVVENGLAFIDLVTSGDDEK